jgi:hypothetical protein
MTVSAETSTRVENAETYMRDNYPIINLVISKFVLNNAKANRVFFLPYQIERDSNYY